MRFAGIAFLSLILAIAKTYFAEPAEPAEAVVSNIARVPVESSALASVGYSKQLQVLEVEFRNGAIYRYLDVPENVFRELMDAPSKTSYYDTNIRGHYHSVHVKPVP